MDDRRGVALMYMWWSFPLHSWTSSSHNVRANGQKLFHISFLKRKSGQVVNSNTLLSYHEDLSGLGCRTIVSHFHCSRSLWSSQITPIASTDNILSYIHLFEEKWTSCMCFVMDICSANELLRFLIWYNTTFNFNDYTLIRRRRKSQRGTKDKQVLAEGRIRAH